MAQEEKELLLKDLCARLPYGVKCRGTFCKEDTRCKGGVKICDKDFIFDGIVFSEDNVFELDSDTVIDVSSVKPYLRPMSSMTKKEQRYIWDKYGPNFLVADFEDVGDVSELFNYCQMNISRAPSFVDWLNENHFDYRGLIEKGLALEAPEDMYKTK